jgi:hypothetical protein
MNASEVSEADSDSPGPVVRDDEADFPSLRDAARRRRGRAARLRVVDSGKLTVSELEWLGEAGAELFTSDLAGRTPSEVILMSDASRHGGGATAYFHHGPLEGDAPEIAAVFSELRKMGRAGVAIALSDKSRAREPERLIVLADDAASGRSSLIAYHHRAPAPWLEELARRGAWIHFTTASLAGAEDAAVMVSASRAGRETGRGVILHIDRPVAPEWLEDFFAAGAFLLFQTPPSDYRSPLRRLEKRAGRRRPAAEAGYLYPEFMR